MTFDGAGMSGLEVLFFTLSMLIVASSLLLFGALGAYFLIGLFTLTLKLKIFRFYCFFGDDLSVISLLSFAFAKSYRSVSYSFIVRCYLGIDTKTLSEIEIYEESLEGR